MKKVALCYTGGKDSTLTLHLLLDKVTKIEYKDYLNFSHDFTKTLDLNSEFIFTTLVTFHPKDPSFLSHPLPLLKDIGKSLNLNHKFIEISGPNYLESYAEAIKSLNVDVLVTGDMMNVCNNFMFNATEKAGIKIFCPLWDCDRKKIWDLVLDHYKLSVFITCINLSKFQFLPEEKEVKDKDERNELNLIKSYIGKKFDWIFFETLQRCSEKYNVDLCGENGNLTVPYYFLKIAKKYFLFQ
ncbi:hypothetical protein HDU92_000199 [Lobulomyces angularis]|nr:hypothetical protein HDU92_000199 [Lobulomyces angularis]